MFPEDFVEEAIKKLNKVDGEFKEFFIENFSGCFYSIKNGLKESFVRGNIGSSLRILKNEKWLQKSKKSNHLINHLKFIEEDKNQIEKEFPFLLKKEISIEKEFSFIDEVLKDFDLSSIKEFDLTAVKNFHNTLVINNLGINSTQEKSILAINLRLKDKSNFIGSESVIIPPFEDNVKDKFRNCLKESLNIIEVKKEGSKQIKGEIPAVFSSRAGGFLLNETVGRTLESDLYENLKTDLPFGEFLCSNLINIFERGPQGGYATYDDEGFKPEKRILVEEGKVVSFLADFKRSTHFSLKEKGNGRRGSFNSKVYVGFFNFAMNEGEFEEEEMIRELPFGIYIKRIEDGVLNFKKRTFSFPIVEGYIIRDGRISEYLKKGVRISGKMPHFLCKIDKMGKKAETFWGLRQKFSNYFYVTETVPPISFKSMSVDFKE